MLYASSCVCVYFIFYWKFSISTFTVISDYLSPSQEIQLAILHISTNFVKCFSFLTYANKWHRQLWLYVSLLTWTCIPNCKFRYPSKARSIRNDCNKCSANVGWLYMKPFHSFGRARDIVLLAPSIVETNTIIRTEQDWLPKSLRTTEVTCTWQKFRSC